MAQKGQIPKEMAVIMTYGMLGFLAVVYIIIPGVLVLFYGNKNVKMTCERRDPQMRWTDKCPLPVLAISLVSGVCAIGTLLMGFFGWTVPFFGYVLNGIAGAGVVLVAMVLLGYVAWGTYKLSVKAWWCAVLMVIAWGISICITFSRESSLLDLYEKMNLSPQELELIKQSVMSHYSGMTVIFGVWTAGLLGYLIYTKRYFKSPAIPEQPVNNIYNSEKSL